MTSQDRAAKLLYSTRNLVGMGCAIVGLVLVIAGVVSGWWWPLFVAGAYLMGWLATPPPKVDRFVTERSRSVDGLVKKARGLAATGHRRLGHDLAGELEAIAATVELLSADLRSGGKATDHFVAVESIVNDYLPRTLDGYQRMPAGYARLRRRDGRTPHDLLLDQLTDLRCELDALAQSAVEGHMEDLESHASVLRSAYREPLEW
jgi:hypothetical protein